MSKRLTMADVASIENRSPRNILVQFLIEAVTLCVLGGGLGVALGIEARRSE